MTPSESHELRTNDEPQRILLEASERIKACYPDGTRIEVEIYPRLKWQGTICYGGNGTFVFLSEHGGEWLFSPAVHPHRVLP